MRCTAGCGSSMPQKSTAIIRVLLYAVCSDAQQKKYPVECKSADLHSRGYAVHINTVYCLLWQLHAAQKQQLSVVPMILAVLLLCVTRNARSGAELVRKKRVFF